MESEAIEPPLSVDKFLFASVSIGIYLCWPESLWEGLFRPLNTKTFLDEIYRFEFLPA
jgi:hypothetical protein